MCIRDRATWTVFLSFTREENRPSGLCYRDTENPLRSTGHRPKELCVAFPLGSTGLGLGTGVSLPVPHTCCQHPHLFSTLLAEAPGSSGYWPAALGRQSAGLIRLESLTTQEVPSQATEELGAGEVPSPESGHSLPRITRQEGPGSSEHSHEITNIVSIFGGSIRTQGTSYPQSPGLCFCLSSSLQPPCGWQLPRPEAHRLI